MGFRAGQNVTLLLRLKFFEPLVKKSARITSVGDTESGGGKDKRRCARFESRKTKAAGKAGDTDI